MSNSSKIAAIGAVGTFVVLLIVAVTKFSSGAWVPLLVVPAFTPTVTNASTRVNVQSATGLVISKNTADGGGTAFYQITAIANGTLFQNDGVTAIANGAFITVAQGAAGLKFTPGTDLNSTNASFGFTVQASTNASNAGLGGSPVAASVVVNPANGSQPVAPQLGSVQYIAVGADAGAPGVARLSDAQTGATVLDYRPFGGSYGGGIQVALGDQNGDGVDELVAATATGAAHVKVRDLKTGAEVRSFLPFGGYMGGLTLSTADCSHGVDSFDTRC